MALVRRGAKVYYYRSCRVDGRVTSRYVGSGELAEACARLDAHFKSEAARRDARYRRESAALDARRRALDLRARQVWLPHVETTGAADARLAAWYDEVEGVFRGAMAAAGCHEHKRTWRRT